MITEFLNLFGPCPTRRRLQFREADADTDHVQDDIAFLLCYLSLVCFDVADHLLHCSRRRFSASRRCWSLAVYVDCVALMLSWRGLEFCGHHAFSFLL